MAYVVFTSHDEELDRRELSGKLVIGRSPECDVAIRDILLSRRHCQIERTDAGWVVLDLGSKNGTFLNGHKITRHRLEDGDVLRIGRCKGLFRAGAFEPAPPGTKKRQPPRPADPTESLAGTIAGMEFRENAEPTEIPAYMPQPQPKRHERVAKAPVDPDALLAQIESAAERSPDAESPAHLDRPLPRPILSDMDEVPRRLTSEVDLSLQVSAQSLTQGPSRAGQEAEAATGSRGAMPLWALAALTILAGGATVALAVILTWR